MSLSEELEILCQHNGDIRSAMLLHLVHCDLNRFMFECDEYTECCISMHQGGHFEEIIDGVHIKKSLAGYIESISLISKNNLSIAEFTTCERSKNVTNLIRLLKEDYPLIKDKFTSTELISYRQQAVSDLLSLIQPI